MYYMCRNMCDIGILLHSMCRPICMICVIQVCILHLYLLHMQYYICNTSKNTTNVLQV